MVRIRNRDILKKTKVTEIIEKAGHVCLRTNKGWIVIDKLRASCNKRSVEPPTACYTYNQGKVVDNNRRTEIAMR